MSLYRVQPNVMDVEFVVLNVSNPVIGKSALPDLRIRTELFLRAMGEAALDELDRSLQGGLWSDQQMEVLGHQDEFVQEIGFALIRQEGFEEKARPGLSAEERAPLPCFGRDEVGLSVVGGMLACGFQNLPSGAKAPLLLWPLRHG